MTDVSKSGSENARPSSPRATHIAIVGAGPAGLIAAEHLAQAGYGVTIYERMPSPGRKFLMAGRGGLNLTHGEDLETFLTRYTPNQPLLEKAIRAFPPNALRAWADELGQQTFAGSSNRIFPRALKASPLMRAWLQRLNNLGVNLKARHTWQGFTSASQLLFSTPDGVIEASATAALLALGGASWPRLGSEGNWTGILTDKGVAVSTLTPSNCGVHVSWSRHMSRHEGQPLKRIAVQVEHSQRRGEAIITRSGLEGGVIYALAPAIRQALTGNIPAAITIDLRPDETPERLMERLARPRGKQSASTFLRKALNLDPPAIALLNEACHGKLPAEPESLAKLIKAVPLSISGLAGMERAISSAGGLSFDALDDGFMIKQLPGVFAAGEMLDWDAPTGGYLLQACFATGVAAAAGMQNFLTTGRQSS